MKFRFAVLYLLTFLLAGAQIARAQVDSVLGQITDTSAETFVSGMSGDGRFVVFESIGNIATENPRNTDGNREIFLFDYAQRRIFQITDTKNLLVDPTKAITSDNIRVEIVNQRPFLTNDGRRIVFSSNATYAYPGNGSIAPIVSTSNPGSFDANAFTPTTGSNNLINDGNTELWIYDIPAVTAVDLASGAEQPVTNLAGGAFTRVTNTLPSRLPVAGAPLQPPVIADDNRDASASDNGNTIAFVSNRDLVPCATAPTASCGNAFPDFDNAEIYVYVRSSNAFSQVSATPRGTPLAPIYNLNPNISGDGFRVSFLSSGDNAIRGMTGGNNADRSDEIFLSDLDAVGNPTGTRRQVTQTTGATSGSIVNIFGYGKRMSRDGRYIAFESLADLTNESGGANQNAPAVFVYDANAATNAFRRVTPRGDADAGATGGDVLRFPTFTDYDANRAPSTLVLATRLNINAAGTIPATAADGLNSDASRPVQLYSYQISAPATTATFTRLTRFPASSIAASTQPYTSNTLRRTAFTVAQTELGTGSFPDSLSEAYYLLIPPTVNASTATFSLFTGASRIPVSESPVPTPTASPSPTPQTPAAVQGISPDMLAIISFNQDLGASTPTVTAVGALDRRFTLPLELGGVSMTINGAAALLKSVSPREITFLVPRGLTVTAIDGNTYPFVVNANGAVLKGNVRIVPLRPDVFTTLPTPGPNGRARAQNITNRVPTTEPFSVTTVRRRGGTRVATVLRLYATGIFGLTNSASIVVRIGSTSITVPITSTNPRLVEPGVYALDVTLPSTLNGAGDQPVILSVTIVGTTFNSRLDDTAPRLRFF